MAAIKHFTTQGQCLKKTPQAYSVTCEFPCISKVNMKRSRRSVAWDHFDLKNDLVHCQHCEAVYKYNSATTQMMYHLNNAHPTLVSGGASCSRSQPSINSVLARRSCDAQRAEKITQRICKFIEMDMLPLSIVEGEGFSTTYWNRLITFRHNVPSPHW